MNRSNVEDTHRIWQFCARSFENIQGSLSEFEKGTACIQIRRYITHRNAMVWLRKSIRRGLHHFHIYPGYVLFTPRHSWVQLLSFQWRYCSVSSVLVITITKQAAQNSSHPVSV